MDKKIWVAAVNLTLPDGTHIPAGEELPAKYKVPKWLIKQGKVK
jgi:hypothetical protein